MSEIRIRPRTSIVDPALARSAVVDLPASAMSLRPRSPRGLIQAVAAIRRPVEPERVIVMRLAPVPARSR